MQDMLELIATAKLAPRGELTAEDVALPEAERTSCLLRLRHTHHLLARALAEGKDNISAGVISGYAPSTVASLQADPAFQELVAHYKVQVTDLFAQVSDRMAALGVGFLDELQHRLETSPESFSIPQLKALAESMLDRTIAPSKGAGKSGAGGAPTAISVKIDFSGGPTAPSPVLELQAGP